MKSPQKLEATGLARQFGGKEVVRGVDLVLGSQEIVGLLGPNGAGKTTIFNMISGLLRPTRGSIRLNEADIGGLPLYRRARLGITYLPQEKSVFRRLTVAQNILAILETVESNPSLRRERLANLLEELGLTALAHRKADSLSGGERRRLEITRALVLDPSFMLLDEPFAGVDPIALSDVQKIIGRLSRRGIGVMVTDHNVRETLRICDRAYIISDGIILKSGNPDEIATDPTVREIYLGENFRLD